MKKVFLAMTCFTLLVISIFSVYEVSADNNAYIGNFVIESTNGSLDAHQNNFIYCFDVSDDGRCALFLDDATVVIMNTEGFAENVIEFDDNIVSTLTTRRPFDSIVQWSGDELELLMGYGEFCRFTTDGQVIGIGKHSIESLDTLRRDSITVGENTFTIRYTNALIYWAGGERYNLLVKTDEQGNETILFKSKAALPGTTWDVLLFILAHPIIVLLIVFNERRKRRQKETREPSPCLTEVRNAEI